MCRDRDNAIISVTPEFIFELFFISIIITFVTPFNCSNFTTYHKMGLWAHGRYFQVISNEDVGADGNNH